MSRPPGSPMSALAEAGLVLQGVIPVVDLDADIRAAIRTAGTDPDAFESLVLLGQAGRTLWDRRVRHHLDAADPFDDTVRAMVAEWFRSEHPDARWEVVYPGDALLPLGRLAADVGWGEPSPLGLTIHERFGLWVAHRIVFLTDLELAAGDGSAGAGRPCEACRDRPCVPACPVDAVSFRAGFDVETCARHRVAPGTECAFQCLARNACPVGSEHRYGQAQMRHHYSSGLDSIRRWLSPGDR